MAERSNLYILQPETISGGHYHDVRFFADISVTGNIQMETLTVYERAIFHGSVTAKKIIIQGEAIFHGPLTTYELVIVGTGMFHGSVKCNRLQVNNQLTSSGKIEAYEGAVKGMAHVYQYDGFTLLVQGFFRCDDKLRCHHMTFGPSGRGNLNEVYGAMVRIQSENYLNDGKPQVMIQHLIAYDVTLRYTWINRLEAKNVNKDETSVIIEQKIIGKPDSFKKE